MDARKFDECTKALATGASRRQVIKGLAGGALGALAVALFGGGQAEEVEAATCRALGEACKPGATGTQAGACCPGTEQEPSHLICQQVGQTGATRCECDLNQGFRECGGRCVSTTCPGGGQLNTTTCQCECGSITCPENATLNTTTCVCECNQGFESCGGQCLAPCTGGQVRQANCTCACPTGTVECPTGSGTCVSTNCPTGMTFNPNTCTCGCPSGQVFCNGACFNPATACSTCKPNNKVFNIECCSCENPGQPSGVCKSEPCTAAGCPCK